MSGSGLDATKLVGVVVSKNLYRGGDMGYCLVITRDEVMGAKKPESMPDFEAYLGRSGNASDAGRAEAKKVADAVAGTKEFLVSQGSIGQVLFKKPGMFSGGCAIIKTSLSSIRINMTVISTDSPFLLETSNKLESSLKELVGERLREMGQSFL